MGLAASVAAAMGGMGQNAEVLPGDRGRVSTSGAFGNPRPRTGPHPAGTKLVRRFIRTSGRESLHWRQLYKHLTGKDYD